MPRHAPDTDELLRRAEHGDEQARQTVLVRHRERLKQMVAVHMDRRLAARIDPFAETLVFCRRGHELSSKTPCWPYPFAQWMRNCERLVELDGKLPAILCGQMREKTAGKAGPAIAQRMKHWLKDDDFAVVRGAESLARFPEGERKEWQKLWQEVETLRQYAAERPRSGSSARP